jgi:hypothetical protein
MKTNLMYKLKKRLGMQGPGVTIGVIAIVLALTGGAIAASGALTGKQKKEVKAIAKAEAKKFQGTGPQGPPGNPGATGASGAKGDKGDQGNTGTSGTDGTSVEVDEIATGNAFECEERGGVLVKEEGSPTGLEVCNGEGGQDAGFNYVFSADTGGTDPGAGNLKFDNAAPGSATLLRISETDSDGNLLGCSMDLGPCQSVINNWLTSAGTKGTVTIRKVGSPGTFAQFNVRGGIACTIPQEEGVPGQCGMTDEGAFEKIRITFIQGNGTFGEGDRITIAYVSSGSTNLPSGAVEMGAWAMAAPGAGETSLRVPISFPIPLTANIGEANVHYAGDAEFATFCKGNLGSPNPEAGHFCLYANANEGEFPNPGVIGTTLLGIFPATNPTGSGAKGTNRAGAVLVFTEPTGVASGGGTWAVRAP